ncbi:thymidine phosphorylase [Rhodobacteraceae bacterium N5(2021)]|uniref:Thymidine phosphorylase n=1 Tax=Gymnodinialimonas phycosphaerae TaxID=2841589 RepID=A0A975YHL7_9RHOB|nr:thymidine phosphorylase [Gymnodinialimonas phycosphaerae]MBY4892831.1 thymidine phosphorylase [Gymnodinialimonas phycosphaerae]
MTDAREILTKLREGDRLTEAELFWFAEGLATGAVTDAQAGAFAMAVCHNGLGEEGRVQLTRAMRETGRILKWRLDGPVIDKHSTGGVGDCVSLVLAPALAACGAFVPMISGRGLGHTGGTLDKLEAIPGYTTQVSPDDLQEIVADIGCAIVGASEDIAPADKRLYAIRDVTGTVASVDLITASILSKKLAAGLEALVLDVKVGSGAFMGSEAEALVLAQALVATAQGAGCMTTALITEMNQPLANAAGNALEIIEVMKVLTGATGTSGPSALEKLTVALGGEVLALGGLAADAADGEGRIISVLESGAAAAVFAEMVAELGGPADFVERWPDRLPAAPIMMDVHPGQGGVVTAIDTRALGEIVVHLGGGRLRGDDRIDPAVGLSDIARLGAKVDDTTPLARIHSADEDTGRAVAAQVRRAFTLSDTAIDVPPLIHERIA